MKRYITYSLRSITMILFLICFSFVFCQNREGLRANHPSIGSAASFGEGKDICLVMKLKNFGSDPDPDILSPKSVNIHPSCEKFYVNSLEGGKTVVYSLPELEKLAVINHKFSSNDSNLWASPSGLFKFRHYTENLNSFTGKPVESAFSHGGRYLWIPYYRRSFDLNAQDPSAVAIIDTKCDSIVRMMEAGVLPKMIANSPDGKTMAITHWGDNTVGLIDVASSNPKDWKYIDNIAVGKQLFHNFSLKTPVNRDSNTGEALRGTVFSPDSRYLFVGCMSGGGIAVIDVQKRKYLGKITGMMANLRHLVIRDGWLYLSINASGYVQRIPLKKIMEAAEGMDGSGNVRLSGWQSTKVAGGARTLELSPKGDYIFVACNSGSKVCIVDSSMNKVGELAADSYPVGLDISPDGKWLITTSQGRKGQGGGNCVDVFSLTGIEGNKIEQPILTEEDSVPTDSIVIPSSETSESTYLGIIYIILISIVALGLLCLVIFLFKRKGSKKSNR